jgi:hypothetical protein
VTGLGPVIACAGYAGLLWIVALGLDAIGRRSLRVRGPRASEEVTIVSDVARFHSVIAGAVLGAGAFLLMAFVVARHDGPALLLVPVAAVCATGALRRWLPLWREP